MAGVKERIALLIQSEGAKRAEADIAGVSRSTKKMGNESVVAGQKTEKASKRGGGALKTLGKMGALGAAGIAGATLAAIAFGKESLDAFEEAGKGTMKLSRLTGMSTESASAWVEEAKLRGIAADQLAGGFGRLGKQMYAAKGGNKAAIKGFKDLGVSMDDIKHGDMDAILGKVADRMKEMKSPTDKVALATQLFGRGLGMKLLPMLADGAAGIDAFKKASEEAGTTIKDVSAYKDHIKEQREMQRTMDGLKIQIGQALLPMMQAFGKILKEITQSAIKPMLPYIKMVGKAFLMPAAKTAIRGIGDTIKNLAGLVRNVIGVITSIIHGRWGKAWQFAKKAAGNALGALGGLAKRMLAPLITLGRIIWNAIGGKVTAAWHTVKRTGGNIVGFVTSLPGKIAAAATGMWNGLKGGLVGVINWVIGKWNGLADSIKIPDWSPVGGGDSILPHVDPIAAYARGGRILRDGPILVGEQGPEIMHGRAGDHITNNHDTREIFNAPRSQGQGGPVELARTSLLELAQLLRDNPPVVVITDRDVHRANKRHSARLQAAT